MRLPLSPAFLAAVALTLSGCRSNAPSDNPAPPTIITTTPLRGQVASVNAPGRFVVLRFPIGAIPRIQHRFAVFREGAKVGELRISGPQYDNNIVADVLSGDCRVGDVVREE